MFPENFSSSEYLFSQSFCTFAVDSYQLKFLQRQIEKDKCEATPTFKEFLSEELSMFLLRELAIPEHFKRTELERHIYEYMVNLVNENKPVKEVLDATYEYFSSPEDFEKYKDYREKTLAFSNEREKLLSNALNKIYIYYFVTDFPSSLVNNLALFILTELAFLEFFKHAVKRLKIRTYYAKRGFRKTIAQKLFYNYIDELLPKLKKYVDAKLSYLRLMFFIDIWNSKDLNQLFKPKRLSLKNVDSKTYNLLFYSFKRLMKDLRITLHREGAKIGENFFEKHLPNTSKQAEQVWSQLIRTYIST
ncbi:MAG: hypothetical protein J7J30_01395 [Candidatus Odinarchaeota archaeon]|nr:hypothetical protein [Candidatus Odinarchaeota archaeon]